MSKKARGRPVFLAALFFLIALHPGTVKAQTVTLKEAVETALKNNRDLIAFRKGLEQAKGDLTKASLILPSNPALRSQLDSRHNTRENEFHTDYELSLSQEVRIAGQRGKGMSAAGKNVEKVQAEIEALEWEITARVKGNFYEVLALKRVLELRELIKGLYEKLLNAFRLKYEAGAATILELNSVEIQYGRAQKEYLDAQGNYLKSLLQLKLILGLPQDYPLDVRGELRYRVIPVEFSALLERALKTRPDLRALELEEERANLDISFVKAQRVPNPILSGFFGREDGVNRVAGGAISIPLPLIDRKQAELQKAHATRDAARIRIEGKNLQISQEVQSACEVFLASQKGLGIYEGILQGVEDSLKLNEVTYLEGKVSFIEFLLLQNNLIETKVSYLGALLGYYKALVELERASVKSLLE